jgi:pilus assembly protein CpaC
MNHNRESQLQWTGGAAVWAALLVATVCARAGDQAPTAPAATIVKSSDGAAAVSPVGRVILVSDGLENGRLMLTANKSALVNTRAQYRRVSIGSPEIADVNPVGAMNVLVTGRKPGSTQMILWDDAERSQVIDVVVGIDLDALREQLKQNFPRSKIDVSVANGQIVLRGRVPSTTAAEQAVQLAQPYAAKVLNFLEVAGGQQVMLQVRFAEVSRSATNALGVNFGFTDGRAFFGNNIGQVSPLGIKEFSNESTGLSTPGPASSVTLFGRGVWGNVAFDYYIQALRQNNLLRVLAEPTVTTMSGQEASFLAGGEFPIPVTQGGGTGAGGTAVTIEYRTFGVKLNFVPIVLGDGRIRLKVSPEVSDLDFTTAVRFNGFVIPGLSQRKLTTVVELNEGQTLALAGLLNNNVSATKDVTPVLGDLPVVGALFRSVRYQRKETELVVIVTPRLAEGVNPAQVPALPGEKWRHPTEGELFWQRDLGGVNGKRAATRPAEKAGGGAPQTVAEPAAPRFRGEYGFVQVGEKTDE